MERNILEVSGLNKKYDNFSLKDVSFNVPEECIVGFIGINGAGKTTTIRSILGLAGKDSGSVKLFGKEMNGNDLSLADRIGIVIDGGSFYGHLTINEMKSIVASAYSKWSDADYKHYIKSFDLDPKQKISTLSKGMHMKFALALALSHHAELLIMDEPTSGLDPLIRSQLLTIIGQYMEQGGKGVFFSTHITSDLEKIADMLILIHNGQILFEQDRESLIETYKIVKGDVRLLTQETKKLFIRYEVTDFGFKAITNRLDEVAHKLNDILIEKPTIEDIMLAHLEGEKK